MPETEVLYSRVEDGAIPITIVTPPEPGNRIYRAGGLVFTSARQLLIALTGHPKARNWTFDRYFKIGRHTPSTVTDQPEGGSVIDLFARPDSVSGLSVGSQRVEKVEGDSDGPDARARDGELHDGALGGIPALGGPMGESVLTESGMKAGAVCRRLTHRSGEELELTTCSSSQSAKVVASAAIAPPPIPRPLRATRLRPADNSPDITVLELLQTPVVDESVLTAPLGIDLERRGHEVVKLLFKGYGRKIHSAGYDPDDVIQEVFKGILVRNHGKSPWDPRRSSFGHYVWMVCGCVMSNYHRKQCRRRAVEQIGLPGYMDGQRTAVDAGAEQALRPKSQIPAGPEQELALDDLNGYLQEKAQSADGRLALRLLPLVHAGYTQQEMVRETGSCRAGVVKALDWLQQQTRLWSQALL